MLTTIETRSPRTVLLIRPGTPTLTKEILGHWHTKHISKCQRTIVSDRSPLVTLWLLCSNHNNTIGCTRTIKSGSRSTLQYSYRFNILWVDVACTTTKVNRVITQTVIVDRHTINNIQWVVARNRRNTTNYDFLRGTCNTTTRNLHTSHLTLKTTHQGTRLSNSQLRSVGCTGSITQSFL